MKIFQGLAVAAAMLFASLTANATILTFDEFNGVQLSGQGTSYDTNGFRFTGSSLTGIGSTYDAVFTTGAFFDNTGDATITLQRIDGNAFSLDSMDFTRFPGYSGTAPIDMFAYDSGNTQVGSLSFTLPAVTQFNTYNIGFVNVHSVSWTQAADFHAFDNVVLDGAVPAPATLALLGLGLLGLRMRRS